MTAYYVDSVSGTSGGAGTSWATAKDSITRLSSVSAGDTIYLSSRHNESTSLAGDYVLTGPVAGAASVPVISTTFDTTHTYEAGATITVSGGAGYDITFDGSFALFGITIDNTNSSGRIQLLADEDEQLFCQDCTFKPGSGTGVYLSSWPQNATFVGCTFSAINDTSNTATNLIVAAGASAAAAGVRYYNCTFTGHETYRTGSIIAFPTNTFLYGCTIDTLKSGTEFFSDANMHAKLVGCILPATFVSSPTSDNALHTEYYMCQQSGETDRLNFFLDDQAGQIFDDQTIYLSSGAEADDGNGGTQTFSWKMVSSAYASEFNPLMTPWLYVWNDTTGSRNVDIYIGENSALTDAEVWIDLVYLGTSGSEKYSYASASRPTPNTTASTAGTTGGTWTGTGAPSTGKYIRKTVTINEKGWVQVRACLGVASTTIWVDPRIVLS